MPITHHGADVGSEKSIESPDSGGPYYRIISRKELAPVGMVTRINNIMYQGTEDSVLVHTKHAGE